MRSRSVRAALAAVAGLFTLVLGAGSVLALGEGTTTFTLDNGMQVVVIPDHRAPVVTHMVWYRVGAADEPRGQSGVAHFLEHLMFKGTEKIAPGEFSRIVARHGGQDNAFTSQDYTGYFQRIAKDRLPLVMEMEADRMSNLQLSDEHVLPERDVVIEERRSRVDNEPASRFGEQLDATFYLSHPYGQPVIGWMHEIEALDREKAIAFYERYYTPNNAILIVAGDVTEQEIRPLAERIYGQIPVRAEVAPRQRPKEPPHEAAQRLTLKDPRVTTPLLRRQYIVPSYSTAEPGEAEALDLLGHILGGGTTSRLYRELVVEDQIASYAAAWYAGDYLDSGTFNFYAGALEDSTLEDVEARMDAVIADVLQNGVTEEEVELAKNSLIADTIYAVDSQARLARIFGVALTSGQTVEDVQTWPDRMERVTKDQIEDVARRYLDIRYSITGHLVGDEAEKSGNDQ